MITELAAALNDGILGDGVRAFAGTAEQSATRELESWVVVRETDRDEDDSRSSDPLHVLYTSFADCQITAPDHEAARAIERSILARQRRNVLPDPAYMVYQQQDYETVDDARSGKAEAVLELQVFWREDYTAE